MPAGGILSRIPHDTWRHAIRCAIWRDVCVQERGTFALRNSLCQARVEHFGRLALSRGVRRLTPVERLPHDVSTGIKDVGAQLC